MSEKNPGRPAWLLHLEEQVWSDMRQRLADIERIADHGPNGSQADAMLVRKVFNACAGEVHARLGDMYAIEERCDIDDAD